MRDFCLALKFMALLCSHVYIVSVNDILGCDVASSEVMMCSCCSCRRRLELNVNTNGRTCVKYYS